MFGFIPFSIPFSPACRTNLFQIPPKNKKPLIKAARCKIVYSYLMNYWH